MLSDTKQIEPQSKTKITGPATNVTFCRRCSMPTGYCLCNDEPEIIVYKEVL